MDDGDKGKATKQRGQVEAENTAICRKNAQYKAQVSTKQYS